jgi:HAD superfamily hydrolase (TIGR01549 family)
VPTRPAALLLDFGGVLVDAPPRRSAPPELVLRLYNLTHHALTPGEIQRALTEGADAFAKWRDEDHPDELSQAEVWERFVIADWPATAQAYVRTAITKLSYEWAWRYNWALRPGIAEMLAAASAAGVPMAVVSNTLSGAAHRDYLTQAGVGRLFGAQIYSDEAGVRKPNPQMIWHATSALGVPAEPCWFVGDSPARDMVCARRAEVGTAILMQSPRTGREQGPDPDFRVEDGYGVLDLLARAG